MTKDDGGLAFPHHEVWDDEKTEIGWIGGGMTLRDWFAAFAPPPRTYMIEMLERSDRLKNPHNDSYKSKIRSRTEITAALRYEYADAMIAERNKP